MSCPADHGLNKLLFGEPRRLPVSDAAPLPQHRHGVGYLENVVEVVGDVHNRLSLIAEATNQGKEVPLFLCGEGSRRLIHEVDRRLMSKSTGNRHHGTLSRRKVTHRLVERDLDPELTKDLRSGLGNPLSAVKAPAFR